MAFTGTQDFHLKISQNFFENTKSVTPQKSSKGINYLTQEKYFFKAVRVEDIEKQAVI